MNGMGNEGGWRILALFAWTGFFVLAALVIGAVGWFFYAAISEIVRLAA